MRLNVTQVLRREKEEKARVKPLPRIRIKRLLATGHRPPALPIIEPPAAGSQQPEASSLLLSIENEEGSIRRARGKLSSSIAFKVIEVEANLRKESPAMAYLFMDGKLETPELSDLYSQIEQYTDRLAELFDQKEYVKKYGTMPPVVDEPIALKLGTESDEVKVLLYQIRRLDDLIHKTNKKMEQMNGGLKPSKPSKLAEWRVKMAMANGQRDDLKMKLKRIQYDNRNKPASLENGTAKD